MVPTQRGEEKPPALRGEAPPPPASAPPSMARRGTRAPNELARPGERERERELGDVTSQGAGPTSPSRRECMRAEPDKAGGGTSVKPPREVIVPAVRRGGGSSRGGSVYVGVPPGPVPSTADCRRLEVRGGSYVTAAQLLPVHRRLARLGDSWSGALVGDLVGDLRGLGGWIGGRLARGDRGEGALRSVDGLVSPAAMG